MLKKAARVELTIDDDEEFLGMYLGFEDKIDYGYISLVREYGDLDIKCEYGDQVNVFTAKTIAYEYEQGLLTFSLSGDEYFDEENRLQELEIELPKGTPIATNDNYEESESDESTMMEFLKSLFKRTEEE